MLICRSLSDTQVKLNKLTEVYNLELYALVDSEH